MRATLRWLVKAVSVVTGIIVVSFVVVILVWVGTALVASYYLLGVLPRLLWRHFRTIWRTFARRPPSASGAGTGAEPARPVYVHHSGLRELRTLWRNLWEACAKEVADGFRSDRNIFGTKSRAEGRIDRYTQRCLDIVECALYGCCALVVTLAAAILLLPALLLQLLVWATILAGFRLAGTVCGAIDHWYRRLTGPAVCPHPDCARTVALPVRVCPHCGARHRRLVPGRHGALRRICRCGTRLPPGTAFGARRLATRCPHCSRPMLRGNTRARVILAVGAPGSGRSAVVRSGFARLPGYVRRLGGSVGGGVSGTAALELFGLRGGRRALVLLDPPGPIFAEQAGIDALDGLRHADGLLLVLDVLALASVARAMTAEDRERIGATPRAAQEPVQAAERVLRTVVALPAGRRPRRIAVLLTKTAVLGRTSVGPGPGTGGDAVRRWLVTAGAGNLVRALEQSGIPVRFLADGPEAADLGGLLLWTAGIPAAPHRFPALRGSRGRRPARRRRRVADGPGPVRHALLASHLVGFVSLPLTLVLLFSAALPPTALFGLPGAFDEWIHPLADFNHDIDVTAKRQGVSWPAFSASYSARGTSPDGPRSGIVGYWSTKGSPSVGRPGASDWLAVDFGMPIPISRVEVELDSTSPPGLEVRTPGSGNRWEIPATVRDLSDSTDRKSGTHQLAIGITASAVRIVIPGDRERGGMEVDGLRVWSPTTTLLQLHLTGPNLWLTNTVNRPVAITVLPPVVPPGWWATRAGTPPRRVDASATVTAGWRLVATADARPGPALYAVNITEDGHTATATCIALLRTTTSGPVNQPVTCDGG